MLDSKGLNLIPIAFFKVAFVTLLSCVCTAQENQTFDMVPDFRTANDCGRVAVYNFANILGRASLEEVREGVPIHDEQGSSLEEMSECLSRLGFRNDVRWIKRKNLSKLTFPAIIRVKNLNDQFHYLVLVQYLESKDKFGILDGERDEVVLAEGKKIRLRSTGFAIVPASDQISIFSSGWIVILAITGVSFIYGKQQSNAKM